MLNLTVNLRDDMRIFIPSWHGYKWSRTQQPSEFDQEYFGDRINFRLPSGTLLDHNYAVLIEQTGRTRQYMHDTFMVKGKITWLTDSGEDQNSCPCWIAVGDQRGDYEID